jgi:hypothetical protein
LTPLVPRATMYPSCPDDADGDAMRPSTGAHVRAAAASPGSLRSTARLSGSAPLLDMMISEFLVT